QRARLANVEHIAARIEHPINARLRLQRSDNLADGCHARLNIRLCRTLERIGRALLIEAFGAFRVGRSSSRAAGHSSQIMRAVAFVIPDDRPAVRSLLIRSTVMVAW